MLVIFSVLLVVQLELFGFNPSHAAEEAVLLNFAGTGSRLVRLHRCGQIRIQSRQKHQHHLKRNWLEDCTPHQRLLYKRIRHNLRFRALLGTEPVLDCSATSGNIHWVFADAIVWSAR